MWRVMAVNPRARTALLMPRQQGAMMPPCRWPGGPSKVSGIAARQTTEWSRRAGTQMKASGVAVRKPKQRFCAAWARA